MHVYIYIYSGQRPQEMLTELSFARRRETERSKPRDETDQAWTSRVRPAVPRRQSERSRQATVYARAAALRWRSERDRDCPRTS